MKSLLLIPLVLACIWDNDTLKEEQRGLPEVAALIEGRFEQHSDFYYEQRLIDEPTTLDDWDNHAVALEKLGRIDDAIAPLEPIVEQHPDRYTAHANLGTFYIHRWLRDMQIEDLDRGIALIERAIEINPDAHFGREKYQLMLAKHVRAAEAGNEDARAMSFVAPMLIDESEVNAILSNWTRNWENGDKTGPEPTRGGSFASAMGDVRAFGHEGKPPQNLDEINEAITGVAGMIRFGTGTSPHLYEALGDLLAARGDKQLAVRAYLRAIEFDHPRADELGNAIDDTLEMVEKYDDDTGSQRLAAEFAEEKTDAAAWVEAFQAFEDQRLRDGVPLTDAAYEPFYAEHGDPRVPPTLRLGDRYAAVMADPAKRAIFILQIIAVGVVPLIVFAGILIVRRRRRRRLAGSAA